MSPAAPRGSRARRWGRRALRGLLIVLLLVGALLGLVVLGINTPWARAQLVEAVNAALATSFQGTLRLSRIERVGVGGVFGVDAVFADASGQRVLEVDNLDVALQLLPLAWDAAVARPKDLRIEIDSVALSHARVQLVDAGQGVPTLATAFESRTPGPPSGGTVSLKVTRAHFEHVWAHGTLGGTAIDAELEELRGALGVTERAVRIEVPAAKLLARALPSRPEPRGDFAGALEVPLGAAGAPLVARARFDGQVWGTPARLAAELRGREISARVDLDSVRAEHLSRVWPGSDLAGAVTLRATLRGTLDRPELSARARLGPGEVDAQLMLDSNARKLNAQVHARRFDLGLIDPELPQSALSVMLTAAGGYSETRDLTLKYRIRLADSQLAGAALPTSEADGDFELARAAPAAPVVWRVQGALRVDEPGARSVFDYRAQGGGEGEQSARVEGTTTLANPARLARLVPGLQVRGSVHSDARFDLGTERLWLDLHADLPEVGTDAARARGVELHGNAEGTFARPEFVLDAAFERLVFADRVQRAGSVRVSGTPERLQIAARAREPRPLELGARVTLKPSVEVLDAELRVGSGTAKQRLSAASVRMTPGRVVGRDVRWVTPSGWVRTSFDYGRGLRTLRLAAHNFDLAEAAAPWELDRDLPRGRVTANVQFAREPKGAQGYVEADVKGLGYGRVDDATARVSARLQRGFLAGSVEARWRGSFASASIDELPLAALPPERGAELAGRLTGRVSVELKDFEPLLAPAAVPLEAAAGQIEATLRLEKRPRDPARLDLKLETSRLHLVGPREELAETTAQAARRAAPWSLTGIDVDLGLALDQGTRELSLDATLTDAKGKLITLQTDGRWPQEAARLPLTRWPSLWQEVEATAKLWLLPRKLSALPDPILVSGIDGTASLSVHAKGSYRNPNIRWMARVEDFGPADARQDLELTTSGDYRSDGGVARVGVNSKDGRVAEATAEWHGDAIGFLANGRETPVARLRGRLDRFPAAAIPLGASQPLAGYLTGAFDVDRTKTDWQAELELESNDFSVARIRSDRMRLRAKLHEGRLEAAFRAAGGALGSIDAELSGRVPVAPGAPERPQLTAKLRARQFQLKSLEPLVSGSVSSLEGLLNADLEGDLSREAPELRGRIDVSRAAAQLPALGQTLHGIEARLKLEQNRIVLNRFEARGLTGKLRARASATLDGLAVRSAKASVDIAEREKMPVMVQGVTLGDAWGRASVEYRPESERRQRLDVDVARFYLELPDVSPPGVQSLDPAAHVEVGHRTRAGKFVEIPLQPIEEEPSGAPDRWIIALKLGAVEVHKGPGIAIGLKGDLRARVGRRTRLDGRIDLTGGKIDVRGKEFKIERGALTFDRSEVEQGVVTATARWDSPEDYTVYAEYSGTVEEGRLRLRSEPPLTQDEILSLVMFGTPGGSFGARQQDEAATAVGLAGGTVTKGLNRALSDFSSLDVSTRVDTSTGEARPELVLQVTPSVTARVTQAIGEAPPGQSPDRTFLTVDLRLFTRWSLSTQVGDEGGSSVDLIWRHRY